MALIIAEVEVEKIVAQFWKSRYGKKAQNGIEIIAPRRGEQFNRILYRHLSKDKPKNKPAHCVETETLKVRLCHNEITDIRTCKYLDADGCRIVNSELRAAMNDIFRNFMYAYLYASFSSGFFVEQQSGIISFFALYNIDMTERNYETLKKNWNRSEEKKQLFAENFDAIKSQTHTGHRTVISLRRYFKLQPLSKRSEQLTLFS